MIEYERTKLNSAILEAYHKACPERRISSRKKVPWWNQELKILRKAANKAFHKAYKSKLEQDWQAHRAAKRAFKKELRRSKRESWQDFCAKAEGLSEISRVYNSLIKLTLLHLECLNYPVASGLIHRKKHINIYLKRTFQDASWFQTVMTVVPLYQFHL